MTPDDLEQIATRAPHNHSDECLLAVIDDTPCICGGRVPLTVAERDALVQMARERGPLLDELEEAGEVLLEAIRRALPAEGARTPMKFK
jgi:hypothetical protein